MTTELLKNKLSTKAQALESVNEISIVENENNYPALTENAMDIISENLNHQPLTFRLFDIVKSPSGGTTAFTVPGISGDEICKELTGIIIGYTTPRAYWDTPDPVEGTPPVCFSSDSIISTEGKVCAHCEFNTFGSKDGDSNAKACKESVVLFLLRPDNIMPIIVRIPVSSKLRFQRYLTRLIGNMLPVSSVVTKITLEKTTNKTGQPYSLYKFEAVDELEHDDAVKAKNFGKQLLEMIQTEEIEETIEKKAS